jgi:hypothetical protein
MGLLQCDSCACLSRSATVIHCCPTDAIDVPTAAAQVHAPQAALGMGRLAVRDLLFSPARVLLHQAATNLKVSGDGVVVHSVARLLVYRFNTTATHCCHAASADMPHCCTGARATACPGDGVAGGGAGPVDLDGDEVDSDAS